MLERCDSLGRHEHLLLFFFFGMSGWKTHISDLPAFQQALKKRYIFAEELLDEVSKELNLPYGQSFSVFEYLSETLPNCEITYLYFSMPSHSTDAEPPVLAHYTYSLSPCISGRPLVVSCINKGGAGKGIEILIHGKSLENSEVAITEATLAYWNRSKRQDHTPVIFEKKQIAGGGICYYGAVKHFRIPEKVSSSLPPAVQFRKESDLCFWFRCIPQCADATPLQITVIVRPVQNPDGGVEWRC